MPLFLRVKEGAVTAKSVSVDEVMTKLLQLSLEQLKQVERFISETLASKPGGGKGNEESG